MTRGHGGAVAEFRAKYPGRDCLDFSASLNPLGLPVAVAEALAAAATDCAHYPDPHCRALRRALSAYEGVAAEQILCGNGAAELIWKIAAALRPRRALLLAPSFSEYALALAAVGCELRFHTLLPETDFAPGPALLEQVEGAELVFLCNPNNPTGRLCAPALLDRLLSCCRETGAVLCVDECFLDFLPDADAHSLKRRLAEAGHLLILRAFTKIFAMPGLRLGYLLGAPALLERIAAAGPPWSVSVPAQRCGIAAAQQRGYLAETRASLPRWRATLAEGLSALGFSVTPSDANFLLFRGRPGFSGALEEKGILLRDCAHFAGLSPGYYRAAVRTPEENAALLREMEGIL